MSALRQIGVILVGAILIFGLMNLFGLGIDVQLKESLGGGGDVWNDVDPEDHTTIGANPDTDELAPS